MSDDYINKITFLLRSRGIDEYRFERLTRSRAVVIPDNGRVCRVVFPLGGADWRGPANLIANLRHALGPFETKAPLGVRAVSSVSGDWIRTAAARLSPGPTPSRPHPPRTGTSRRSGSSRHRW